MRVGSKSGDFAYIEFVCAFCHFDLHLPLNAGDVFSETQRSQRTVQLLLQHLRENQTIHASKLARIRRDKQNRMNPRTRFEQQNHDEPVSLVQRRRVVACTRPAPAVAMATIPQLRVAAEAEAWERPALQSAACSLPAIVKIEFRTTHKAKS